MMYDWYIVNTQVIMCIFKNLYRRRFVASEIDNILIAMYGIAVFPQFHVADIENDDAVCSCKIFGDEVFYQYEYIVEYPVCVDYFVD